MKKRDDIGQYAKPNVRRVCRINIYRKRIQVHLVSGRIYLESKRTIVSFAVAATLGIPESNSANSSESPIRSNSRADRRVAARDQRKSDR